MGSVLDSGLGVQPAVHLDEPTGEEVDVKEVALLGLSVVSKSNRRASRAPPR